jgi:hypothetical protein
MQAGVSMLPAEARHLRDLIFAVARVRGVVLQELNFRLERGIPELRFTAEGATLIGCRIRIPGGPTSVQTGITVSGPSDGWSRGRPRKRDDSFDISAVTDFVVALVDHEIAKPPRSL